MNKVFQGKMMRENATLFEKITYSYARPLLESSMTQQIKFEQYGELPDRLKICHESKYLESNIQHYFKQNQQDRYAFMKGILRANKWNFAKFSAIRCLLTSSDLVRPLLLVNFVNWLMSTEPDTPYTFCSALFMALLIPIIRCFVHTIWEYFCF